MSKEHGPLATVTSKLLRKRERLGDKTTIAVRKMLPLYSNEERSEVETYYQSRGKQAVIPSSITDYVAFYALGTRDKVLITPSRPARGIAKLLGKQRASSESALTKASLHAPMRAALQILSERGIPCYFVNRVGLKKDGYPYTRAARERMRHHLNFPAMASNVSLYEEHLRAILGEKYSKAYIEQLQQIPQVIFKGGKYAHEDASSQLVNTLFGRRVTVGQIDDADLELHVYGRCGAFGYAVEDADTLPSRLQAWLIALGANVRVENHGLWGGDDACILQNFFQEVESLPANSVVLFYMKHFEGDLTTQYERLGMKTSFITDEWHAYDEARWCFYDKPGHMNAIGYDHAAEIIARMLVEDNFKGLDADSAEFVEDPRGVIRAYAEDHGNGAFYQKLNAYLDGIVAQVPEPRKDEVRGAIVMNCNPFTKGHEYLIRKAASEVDKLFVFVVQEDRSIFEFEDRIEMVRRGTAGIDNVLVFPSGEFMISTVTFPEYFLKDYVKEKDFDVSGDLELFCQRICPRLGITIRYAGEEPNDPVTAHYNETMSDLLPRYGMEFREVPRLLQKSGDVVNATEVRRRIVDGDLETLDELLPESTIEIVRQKYV